jgi:hypothetical protein
MAQPRTPAGAAFHFIYNTVYFLLCLVLAALILITPADTIRQAYFDTFQYSNIVIIAIAYLVTVLLVLFIYSLRLYITRTVLASIPKNRIPVGKGDMPKGVREMVRKELARSAAIALEARPKVGSSSAAARPGGLGVMAEEATDGGSSVEEQDLKGSRGCFGRKKPSLVETELGVALPPTRPVWGEIEHPGWGSPDSLDLPNIQYSAVIAELPNLIEAKAISLAPATQSPGGDPHMFDPEAVVLLQRAGNMTMRSYVGRLVDLGVLEPSQAVNEFLDTYEYARFSTRPMPVNVFRRLMHLFAELLRSAQPLDRSVVDTVREMDDMYTDSEGNMDIDDYAPQNTGPTTPARSVRSLESEGSGGSRIVHPRPALVTRLPSGNTKVRAGRSATAASNRNPRTRDGSTSAGSTNSFAQTRRPFGSFSSSGISSKSISQGSEGSVIRLSRREDGVSLPYVLRVGDTL